VLEIRKKHGIAPKIPTCSGHDSHNEQTSALKMPLQTELQFHSRRYEQPPTLEGLRDDKIPGGSPPPTPAAATTTSAPGGQTTAAMTSGQPAGGGGRRRSRWRRSLLRLTPPQHQRRQPPAHRQIPTQILPDGRAPTSTRKHCAEPRAGQPKNTNAALAARDVLGGPRCARRNSRPYGGQIATLHPAVGGGTGSCARAS
jgi:hypothetical protein